MLYEVITAALATKYQTQRGWQVFKDNPERWHELLQASLPPKDFDLDKFPRRLPESENIISDRSAQKVPPSSAARHIQRLARRLALFGADRRYIIVV